MNKLTALSKLANAFHNLNDTGRSGSDAQKTIEEMFGYIRRSLRIEDLAPQPKSTEGLNPSGPKYL